MKKNSELEQAMSNYFSEGYEIKTSHLDKAERPLYDTLYVDAGVPVDKFAFFQESVEDKPYYYTSTNMELRGQLPRDCYFLVNHIRVRDTEGLRVFARYAYLEFMIGSCVFLTAPLKRFWGHGSELELTLLLVPQQHFCVFVKMCHGVQFNFPYTLECQLDGDYYRPRY